MSLFTRTKSVSNKDTSSPTPTRSRDARLRSATMSDERMAELKAKRLASRANGESASKSDAIDALHDRDRKLVRGLDSLSTLEKNLKKLSSVDSDSGSPLPRHKEGSVPSEVEYPITGTITLDVKTRGTKVDINIIKCEGLAAADSNGQSDPYVKCYLYYHHFKLHRGRHINASDTSLRIPHSKLKTQTIKKTLNPQFDEILTYDFDNLDAKIDECVCQVEVWDWDRWETNDFLGCIRIPLREVAEFGSQIVMTLRTHNEVQLWELPEALKKIQSDGHVPPSRPPAPLTNNVSPTSKAQAEHRSFESRFTKTHGENEENVGVSRDEAKVMEATILNAQNSVEKNETVEIGPPVASTMPNYNTRTTPNPKSRTMPKPPRPGPPAAAEAIKQSQDNPAQPSEEIAALMNEIESLKVKLHSCFFSIDLQHELCLKSHVLQVKLEDAHHAKENAENEVLLRDKMLADQQTYIDSLLVKVLEQCPGILQSS